MSLLLASCKTGNTDGTFNVATNGPYETAACEQKENQQSFPCLNQRVTTPKETIIGTEGKDNANGDLWKASDQIGPFVLFEQSFTNLDTIIFTDDEHADKANIPWENALPDGTEKQGNIYFLPTGVYRYKVRGVVAGEVFLGTGFKRKDKNGKIYATHTTYSITSNDGKAGAVVLDEEVRKNIDYSIYGVQYFDENARISIWEGVTEQYDGNFEFTLMRISDDYYGAMVQSNHLFSEIDKDEHNISYFNKYTVRKR